ncbi:protein arginine N-methyltransferase 5 [Hyalella azteca]|uniref:Protein arginine N-methyltransferase n=1 Tax=Hyalella azteca TaxID=294128 RepID=A0A8B7N2S7_HYAAZ|nr:protein arginine N-methyltransferase 5 [Hyalella azteca]
MRASCGLEPAHVHELRDALQETSQNGYDFTSIPLVHPRLVREHVSGAAAARPGPFTRSDMLLSTSDWSNLVVVALNASACQGCDSGNRNVVANSEASLQQELLLASHLSVPVVMARITSQYCINLARILHNKVVAGCSYLVWVRVPLVSPADEAAYFRSDIKAPNNTDTWTWWNRFHSIANTEKKIGLCLEIGADLPDEEVLERWLGEPVRCAVLPTSIWLTNKKGFPVLSSRHQLFVKKLHKLHSQFLITGHLRHPHLKFYQQYLDHIVQSEQQNEDAMSQYVRGYEDYLQCPLQPLMDNLESQTYEVFEKDPIKYQEYERAIYDALVDLVPEENKDERTVVVMVVGAGRGPLVRRALTAASQADRKIKLYAVEKNPNAVLTLHAWQEMEWGDKVSVVSCDMRDWQAPEEADILVSELLGSFGDNELSPECLDGAQKFLKSDGISIPSSYTSYIAPLQSPKLYNEVRSCREKDKHFLHHYETPYVVYLHNKREIAPSQELFTFNHPNRSAHIDNRRHKALQFRVTEDSAMHAIAGYFEATLYKEVKISIRPETHSPGMFSWFPILFPIKEPINVHAGEIIEIHFWRCVTSKNVWYEWCVTDPVSSAIHNPNGRAYTIGL